MVVSANCCVVATAHGEPTTGMLIQGHCIAVGRGRIRQGSDRATFSDGFGVAPLHSYHEQALTEDVRTTYAIHFP